MLLLTLVLRAGALLFNVVQAGCFAGLAKDIVYRIRLRLIERLKRISLGEYESLGSGTVTAHLVADLDTLDKFIGETLSRFLVALLTLVGTAAILMWMHWQLALLILLFNPLVIFATVQLGKQRQAPEETGERQHLRASPRHWLNPGCDPGNTCKQSPGFFLGRLGVRAQEVRDYAVASQWKSDASSRASGLLFQFGIDIFRAAAMLTVLFSHLSIGQMLAVFSYLWFMIGPVEQLLNLQYAYYAAGGALSTDQRAAGAGRRAAVPRRKQPVPVPRHRGYRGARAELRLSAMSRVLDQLDLSIAPGEKVAHWSAPAAVARAPWCSCCWACTRHRAGTIRLAAPSLQDIGLETVREHVAVVLQHPALFNDTCPGQPDHGP